MVVKCQAPNCRVCALAKQYSLQPREIQIVALLCQGMGSRELSASMGWAESTVGAHVSRIARQVGVRGRPGIAWWACRNGIGGWGDWRAS